MSHDAIIRVENLSKGYQLSHQGPRREGLRHRLENFARSPLRWLKTALNQAAQGNGEVKLHKPGKEEFWALKDVTFEVKRGEVVGIIGRNGAGKSTLLKILSRITEPTTGRVTIEGRVASLLEVGTGFHPELTGRENIFLNGAILGMTRSEIRAKFDEIVDFAEVERFLDTPVKHYSSGMYVRLAFAVAAHLEPEILIVDEVLAVGDAQFQKKCLGKMQDVAGHGRTVLFVSHNIQAIQRLCTGAVLLEQGHLAAEGGVEEILNRYMAADRRQQANKGPRETCNRVQVTSWHLSSPTGEVQHVCRSNERCTFVFHLKVNQCLARAQFGFVIRTTSGDLLITANSRDNDKTYSTLLVGKQTVAVSTAVPLRAGHYQIEFAIADEFLNILDNWQAVPLLRIISSEESVLPEQWRGVVNGNVTFHAVK